MIKLENIRKSFNRHSPNKNEVLKSVSFTLPNKGLIAIFGKSGSGKTTLLNILGGLTKPDGGTITFNGQKFTKISDRLRNREIGFVFQNYYLEKNYKITEIIENQMIISGVTDKKIIEEETKNALELVEMTRFKNKTGDSLSGGQQQRVAIARAIAKKANVILADEPTGNLDSSNTTKVMDILKNISKTRLVVLVTHELSLIEKYADNFIELVDGEVVHNLEASEAGAEEENFIKIPETEKLKTGKLFTVKRIFRHLRFNSEERFYSTANIFRQIFIIVFSLVMCFFGMRLFEVNRSFIEDKKIKQNAIYTDLKTYPEIRKLDKSLYDQVNFFETNFREGKFKVKVFDLIEELSAKYIPESLKESFTEKDLLFGLLPKDKEVVISKGLLDVLVKETGIKTVKNDKLARLLLFDNVYKVSGVVNDSSRKVYFNRAEYLNFLKVYYQLNFDDVTELFFKGAYRSKSYFTSIKEASQELRDDEAVLEVNRNALFKMLDNSQEADVTVEKVNAILMKQPKLIQIKDSKLYIKKIVIVKTPMDTDVSVLVSQTVLKDMFVYMKPNLNVLEKTDVKYSEYYFEITTNDRKKLKAYFSENHITETNVENLYIARHLEAKEEAFKSLQIILIAILLLFLIYYFFCKAESIKNSKEYGIYRAIGINKRNLIFKELVSAGITNLISFTIAYIFGFSFIIAFYLINSVSVLMLILFGVGIYLVSIMILMLISIIPYMFVIYMMPSDILAKYDI